MAANVYEFKRTTFRVEMTQARKHALYVSTIIVVLPVLCFSCVRDAAEPFGTTAGQALRLTCRIIGGPLTLFWYVLTSLNAPSNNLSPCAGVGAVDCVLNTLLVVLPASLGVIAYVRIPKWDTLVAASLLWVGTGWYFGYGIWI